MLVKYKFGGNEVWFLSALSLRKLELSQDLTSGKQAQREEGVKEE